MPRRGKGEEHTYQYHPSNGQSHRYNPKKRVFDGQDIFHKHPSEPEWETDKKEAEFLIKLEEITSRKKRKAAPRKKAHPIKTLGKKTKRYAKKVASRR